MTNRPLDGKVSLVTGGVKRVGKAIAIELAKNGSNLALHYHLSKIEAEKTKTEIESAFNVKVWLVYADLNESREIKNLVEDVYSHFQRIDILINSASIFNETPYASLDEEQFDKHLSINLKAPYLLSKYCGDIMLLQKAGHIINISDASTLRTKKNYLPYNLSKAGLNALTHSLALELAPHVLVNSIAPGPVLLPLGTTADKEASIIDKIPLSRIGMPDDVALAVLYLVRDAKFTTGAIIPVDGGRFTI